MEVRCGKCEGCQKKPCGNCIYCGQGRGKSACKAKQFAGSCQDPPQPRAPRRDPEARRAAIAKAPAPKPKGKAQWSDLENEKANELYAEGGRDRKTFGEDLSAALKGSKTPAECAVKYKNMRTAEPKHFHVFAYDKKDPKKHSAELIAALPEELQTLERDEIKRLWEEEVESKGWDGAVAFVQDARDRVFNYNLGKTGDLAEMINMLADAGLPPPFLDLKPKPPKRNTKAFRDAFERLLLLAMNEKKHREASLNLLTGKTNPCDWGFLDPGQKRSDAALREEMSKKSCILVALSEGANPRTQLPKARETADIKTMSIWPAFEAVACDAKHATCPSYARQFRCATRGAFVTHPSRAPLAITLLFGITQVSIAGSVSAALLLRAAACGSSTGTTSSTAWRSLGACGRLFAWPAFAGCAMGASFTSATWCGRRSGGGG